MADQPSAEGLRQANAGHGVGRDVGDQVVNLIKAFGGGIEVPAGDFDDVINQCSKVLVDQRMSNDAHQAAVPPAAFVSRARCAHAPDVMDSPVRTGSQVSGGSARRRWTSASKRRRSLSRDARARAISPETAALMFGYSPLSTSSRAKLNAASVKLTLCLCAPIIFSTGSPLEYHGASTACLQ